MGFIGSPAGMRRRIGNRFTEYTGLSLVGEIGPPSAFQLRQLLTGTSDGLTLNDSVGILTGKATIGDVPVVQFDGTNTEMDTGVTVVDATQTIDLECSVIFDSVDVGDGVIGQGSFGGAFGLSIQTGGFLAALIRPETESNLYAISTFAPVTGIPYNLKMTWDGASSLELFLDEVSIQTATGARSGDFEVGNIFAGRGLDGTATRFHGKMWNVKVNGVRQYPMQEGIGTTSHNVVTSSNHATITNGSWTTVDGAASYFALHGGRIDGSDTQIPALLDGSACADGNPIENVGGRVYNGFAGTIRQTDPDGLILPSIKVSRFGIPLELTGIGIHGKPTFTYMGDFVYWDSSNWVVEADDAETWTHPTATGFFPPKTEWPVGSNGSDPVTIEYNSWWIENENYARRSYADWLARPNLTQRQIDQWEKENTICTLQQVATYAQDTLETLSWINAAFGWGGDQTCGTWIEGQPALDANGVQLLTPAGEAIFV